MIIMAYNLIDQDSGRPAGAIGQAVVDLEQTAVRWAPKRMVKNATKPGNGASVIRALAEWRGKVRKLK